MTRITASIDRAWIYNGRIIMTSGSDLTISVEVPKEVAVELADRILGLYPVGDSILPWQGNMHRRIV